MNEHSDLTKFFDIEAHHCRAIGIRDSMDARSGRDLKGQTKSRLTATTITWDGT